MSPIGLNNQGSTVLGLLFINCLSQVSGLNVVYKYSQPKPKIWLIHFVNCSPMVLHLLAGRVIISGFTCTYRVNNNTE